jgi:hypothetical protein
VQDKRNQVPLQQACVEIIRGHDAFVTKSGVVVEKLFSRDFTNEIRSQVIESSFAVGAEIH